MVGAYLSSHLSAALRASAAGVDTVLHVADPLAVTGALGADFGALAADMLVVLRADQHEMGRRPQISAQAVISRKCRGSVCSPPASRQWCIAVEVHSW
jgi:hypothetical protein